MDNNNNKFYWETVMREFLNRNNPGYRFIFTHWGETDQVDQNTCFSDHGDSVSYYVPETSQKTQLTERQGECLYHLAQKRTVKMTAQLLSLSPRTVESYCNHLKTKLNCNKKQDMIQKVTRLGLFKVTGNDTEAVIPPQEPAD